MGPRTRREALGRAGAALAAGTALIAGTGGCGSSAPTTGPPSAPRQKISELAAIIDVDVLNGLLDHEHEASAAYTVGVPLLSGPAQDAAKAFLSHEIAHVNELSSLIVRHGGIANGAQPSYDFGRPRSHRDLLRLFERLERQQISAYIAAVPQVQPGALRGTLVAMLGSDAQHLAVLRAQLGKPALSGALVTGSD